MISFFTRPLGLVLYIGLQLPANAQQHPAGGFVDPYKASIDTNEYVQLVYPPLTAREGKGLDVPVPPPEHPRLYFRKKDIPALERKITSPLMKDCWEGIQKNAAAPTEGMLLYNADRKSLNNRLLSLAEAKAFMYAFRNDRKAGMEAVNTVLGFDNKSIFSLFHRDIGRTIVTYSVVYDWCYDLIDSAQKKELIGRMESLATKLEFGWPSITQGSLVGHGSEAKLARDMLSCGIATYDEKPEIYRLAAGRIIAEFVPGRLFFYPSAAHHQGSAYGNHRFIWDTYITLLFDRMGYPQIFGKDQVKVPYRLIYTRRPDGQFFREGDDFTELFTAFGKRWPIVTAGMLGSYYKDSLLMAEAVQDDRVGKDLYDFLLVDPFVPAKADKSALPLTKYFAGPLGAMVARTGWEENIGSSNVVADMKIGVYNYANHQHLDAGNFQLYYKGPLAINSGIYQGNNGSYGDAHFINYYQRSIAHNTMLVYDPKEKFYWHGREVSNDGGQLYPNGAAEPANMEMLLRDGYKIGEVLAHAFGPDSLWPEYTYLKGELAPAYGPKVKSFRRSFVFLNLGKKEVPAALIVFDRVTASDKSFKKSWLLHCVEEPAIAGNRVTIQRSEKGYNGQLINTTLLPLATNTLITKTGGPGNEFRVNDQNYTQAIAAANNSGDHASWRVEVSPKAASGTDLFLNVLQVMDRGITSPLAGKPVETAQFTGVAIGDRLVLFNKNSEPSGESLDLTVSTAAKVLITDLATGDWRVECLGRAALSPGVLKNREGLLYFNAAPGKYRITKLKQAYK